LKLGLTGKFGESRNDGAPHLRSELRWNNGTAGTAILRFDGFEQIRRIKLDYGFFSFFERRAYVRRDHLRRTAFNQRGLPTIPGIGAGKMIRPTLQFARREFSVLLFVRYPVALPR
jgi:hypothetical protein